MPKAGRPKKPKAQRRTPEHQLRVSLTKVERAAIDKVARQAFPNLDPDRVSARWARDILIAATETIAKADQSG